MSMEKPQRTKNLPVVAADACCDPVAPSATPAQLAPARAARLAEQLRALADPTRLRMLDLLAQQVGPICVCDITARFDLQQPTISHHLRILREAGLVDCEKRGVWAYYWATPLGKQHLAVVETLA
jgi:ArsR family transcriptional regulator